MAQNDKMFNRKVYEFRTELDDYNRQKADYLLKSVCLLCKLTQKLRKSSLYLPSHWLHNRLISFICLQSHTQSILLVSTKKK